MNLTLSPDLERAITEQSRRLGTTPENMVVSLLKRQLMPELYQQSASLPQERRKAALAKIRSGKYACRASQ